MLAVFVTSKNTIPLPELPIYNTLALLDAAFIDDDNCILVEPTVVYVCDKVIVGKFEVSNNLKPSAPYYNFFFLKKIYKNL